MPTLRFWTSKGLLEVAEKTDKGYALYGQSQIAQVKRILELKAERYNLEEIRIKLRLPA